MFIIVAHIYEVISPPLLKRMSFFDKGVKGLRQSLLMQSFVCVVCVAQAAVWPPALERRDPLTRHLRADDAAAVEGISL
ncbi:MAG: hypothetical protein MJY59_00590, partial [Bacteroidaceae bacterium]|nr:hypothetical protein [Bacteroidaceae bacterium]